MSDGLCGLKRAFLGLLALLASLCPRRRGPTMQRSRPAGGCSTISPSTIPARSRTAASSASSNMPRCANSRPPWRSASPLLPAHPQRAELVAGAARPAPGGRAPRAAGRGRPPRAGARRGLARRLPGAARAPGAARSGARRGALRPALRLLPRRRRVGPHARRRFARSGADRLHRRRARARAQPVRALHR